MRGRLPRSNREFTVSKPPIAEDVPLVVLINGGSASASEIVSGAIQDLDRGVILGQPTFGKGLVQTVYNLSHKTAVKVTTARYYTPSGRLIQRDRSDEDENEMGADLKLLDSVTEVDTVQKFYTRSGREVFGGGGISPDIEVKPKKYPDVAVEMFRKDLFFGFVNQWFTHHERMDTVQIPDSMVDSFYTYMDEVDFHQSVEGTSSLDELREIGDKDSFDENYFELIEKLEQQLSDNNDLYAPDVREFILQSLDREIASNLGGRVWRIRSTFDEDTLLTIATDILHDPARYNSLLQSADRSDLSDGDN
jgi:carboxyl-terminal processing protease